MNNDLNKNAVVDETESSMAQEIEAIQTEAVSSENTVKSAKSINTEKPQKKAESQSGNQTSVKKKKPVKKTPTENSEVSKEESAQTTEAVASAEVQTTVKKKSVNKKPSEKKSAKATTAKNVEKTAKDYSEEEGKHRIKLKSIPIAVPIITAIAILTVGVVVSSATLGLIGGEKHEAFISTEQSNAKLSTPSGKFLSGISVAKVDLGGKTMKEAQELLQIEESEMIPSIDYTLNCHDKIVYLTEDDFEYNFDTVKVLNEAYEYSEYMRELIMDEGRTELKSSEKKDFDITMEFNEKSIQEVCKNVAKKVNVEMQDAHVTSIDVEAENIGDMFHFEEGVVGYSIDVDDLATQISTLMSNDTYTADVIGQMEVVEPSVDLNDLKKHLVLISQYQTYSGNTWAGNMNMTVAMQSMNGSVIKKGETFSFNEKTGNSNLAENGYYSAGVIVNGQSADGIGGGICQAATTIYNAAIRAGMTIVEREPHTWPSVYVPVGIDSAIDYGNIDMKFRNDTDHEVYLICYMDGAQLNAFIYGYRPSDFDEIVVSSWFTGGSGIGFGAAAERHYYKNGELQKTEELPASFYSNGGGTSYAYDEPLSGYSFKRVYTDKQIAEDEKKATAQDSNNEVEISDSDTQPKEEDNGENATNDNANSNG